MTAIAFSTSRSSDTTSEEIRYRALMRLYERRDTVDELISALERYQRERQTARCIDISVGRKCLSGCAQ
jgi:hypothetical protein